MIRASWSCTRRPRGCSSPAPTSASSSNVEPTTPSGPSTPGSSSGWKATAGRPSPWSTARRWAAAASWRLACDLRVASTRARFGQPELGLGIIAGAGGNWRLAQLVGLGAARRLLYLGEIVDAGAAREMGLVDAVHEPDAVLAGALDLVERIARQSSHALELTKLALRRNRPATTMFDVTAQALLFESEDKRIRMQAFLDRRRDRDRPAPTP